MTGERGGCCPRRFQASCEAVQRAIIDLEKDETSDSPLF